jgi:hypothetical protein
MKSALKEVILVPVDEVRSLIVAALCQFAAALGAI